MNIVIEIVLVLLLLRGIIQVSIGLCQILAGVVAGVAGGILFSAATLLHWLILLWRAAFPRQ